MSRSKHVTHEIRILITTAGRDEIDVERNVDDTVAHAVCEFLGGDVCESWRHEVARADASVPPITLGNVRVEWNDIGERMDENNRRSARVLRLEVSTFDGDRWNQYENGSVCTMVRVSTHPDKLTKLLVEAMSRVYRDVIEGKNIKNKMSLMSWWNAEDMES